MELYWVEVFNPARKNFFPDFIPFVMNFMK